MTERDVVVIGSGHNALVAACYLARAGLDVEVIERDTVVGGAVSTVERFPGIRMDRGSSAHIMIRHTGIVDELELARHGLRYVDMDPWGFVPARGEAAAISFWTDVDRTCASIERACGPRDAAAYRRFVAEWLPRNRVVFDFFQQAPTLPRLGTAMASLARLSRGRVRGMVRELLGSADAILEHYFEDERLRSALAWMAAQSGPPSHEPATADLLGWLAMLHVCPPGRPVGGSGELTQAMARALAAHGGTLSTGDPAVSVEPDAGRLRVTLGSGRAVRSAQVVSGIHVWTTAQLIAQTCPPAAERLQATARPGNGIGMVLRLATTAPPRYAGDDDGLAHRSMALLCDDRVELRRCYGEFLAGRAPSNPAALVMCPTVDDPSLAPDGIHTVTVWGQWHAYALSDESWETIGAREAKKLIDVVERHAPGFRASIVHTHVQTPVDIETEIGMHRGNVMHLEMTLDQMFSLRPTAVDSSYRVAGAPGLYLTGASTHPGGGVFGASGRSAARAVLADRRLGRRRLPA
ncbi:NAD(P)/FAD-dependent oxidoreductase [Blastococcus sp. Marseille-P5729]|uniref:phytoene desaturase family protein n=1 Tax=Blastococcus sp. Marseille-P5729 TaxID=2086582 RepID=UPI000D1139D7|nr:NAD(P)/FAD-dependent oxidoreductase [Blastococcus sp. Marseille-P5729]